MGAGEYVAVGSAVVQVVTTSDKQSNRIIYRKAKDRLMVHALFDAMNTQSYEYGYITDSW